jgi:hypothetical protein
VFGQIKQARGFRQFLLRGFEKVRAEWAIVCTVHNLVTDRRLPLWDKETNPLPREQAARTLAVCPQ